MSNIPAPGSGYSDYGYYGGALRGNFAADPYAGSEGGYSSSDIGAYKQQLQAYYQNLMSVYQSLQAGDPRRAQCEQYLQMTMQYAQEVGLQLQGAPGFGNEWDPNAGAMPGQGVSFPISYQDGNHIVTDEGPSTQITVRQNDSITKQIDVYQKTNTLQIPSSAASVNIVQTAEGTDVKWEVTITFPNGSTRKIIYHNVDREGFQLNLQSPDTSQVTVAPSVSGGAYATKLNNSELGSSSQTQQAGDPPTRMDGDKRVYDGTSFDISPVQSGTNKQTKVMASGDVSITPNSNEEYYVMEYQAGPPAKYIVKVYANDADKTANKIKETITIDGALIDHISFAGDPSRIEFAGALGSAGDAHTLNSSAPGAAKITLGSTETLGGKLFNEDYPADTELRVINDSTHTAISDVEADQVFHTTYDRNPPINTIEITAGGTVDLYPARQSDTVEVTASGDWYLIKFKGTDASGNPQTITYKVKKNMVDKVVIHADESQITGAAAGDAKIQKGGATSSSDETSNNADAILTALKTTLGGKTDAQILSALNANGFSFADINALKAAMNASPPTFPPSGTPSNTNFHNLIKALYALDSQLSGQVNASLPWNHTVIGPAYKQATQRLVTLLQQLYPNNNISMTYPNATNEQWRMLNNITFDGAVFNWTNESENHQGEILVQSGNG